VKPEEEERRDWESKQWGQISDFERREPSNFEKTLLSEKEKQFEKLRVYFV